MNNAEEVLEHVFGYKYFRAPQKEIIDCLTLGDDALVIMPTGGGKSLCYQIPALIRSGTAIVISPLIALMEDQVTALRELGVQASYLNSSLDAESAQQIEDELRNGKLDLLYIAPERLIQSRSISLFQSVDIALFAIDEAHCVSQWGHDFRADYLKLSLLEEHFPAVPRIALTATADERTRKEIIARLGLADAKTFISGFDRPNIQYHIQQKNKPKTQMLEFLENEGQQQAGIIYCLSRKKVEQTAEWLNQKGFLALPYHAGMSSVQRQKHQTRFLREENIIMVATIAFGMGIDKPDVRFVLHLDMPKSVEAYYQETGRAGRDGEPSKAILYYGLDDVIKLKQMMQQSQGNEDFKRVENQRLNAMLGLCEITSCRRKTLLRYFGDELRQDCGNCDNCLHTPETYDASEAVSKALSCIYRSNQKFGAMHIIDILRGADNEKIRQFGHHALSTYGIGKELSVNAWRSLLRQLVARGLVDVDSQYGSLKLHESCRAILRGDEKVFLRKEIHQDLPKEKIRQTKPQLEETDLPLWAALRQCRKQLAETLGVPPYVIFHDSTLREILETKPLTAKELLKINGIGDRKLEQYGEHFLGVIKNFEQTEMLG